MNPLILAFISGIYPAPLDTTWTKLSILEQHAPYFMIHSQEKFNPSSVEFHFNHTTRVFDRSDTANGWVLESTAEFGVNRGHAVNWDNESFEGQSNLSDVPVYAYYLEKEEGVVDLSYYTFFPFNYGKQILGLTFGNHIGDWEHVTIRLVDGVASQIYVSTHTGGEVAGYDEIEVRGGRPVFYCALGSHGYWKSPGVHVYATAIGGAIKLKDVTDDGRQWDSARNLEAYSWSNKTGLAVLNNYSNDGRVVPEWMKKSNYDEGIGDEDPKSGPIMYWGDQMQRYCLYGYCIFTNGPTGPIDKAIWGTELR